MSLWILLLLSLAFSTAHGSSTSTAIDGSLFKGASQQWIRQGGRSITFHLSGRATFDITLPHTILRQNVVNAFKGGPEWDRCQTELFGHQTAIDLSWKDLVVTLGPCPTFALNSSMIVLIQFPNILSVGETQTLPQRRLQILPQNRLALSAVDVPSGTWSLLHWLGEGAETINVLKLVSGDDCTDAPAAGTNAAPVNASFFSVRSSSGGRFSVCYGTNAPSVLAEGQLTVAGPIRFEWDHDPVAGGNTWFRVFGEGLSSYDQVAILPKEESCADASPQFAVELHDGKWVDVEIEFTSADAGDAVLCYKLALTNSTFQQVGSSFAVKLPPRSHSSVIVDRVQTLQLPQDLSHLSVKDGHLTLGSNGVDKPEINVTTFEWTGGVISGYAVIKVTGKVVITGPTKDVPFTIVNYGTMSVAANLHFVGHGSVRNFGTANCGQVVLHGQRWEGSPRSTIVNEVGGTILLSNTTTTNHQMQCEVAVINSGMLVVARGSSPVLCIGDMAPQSTVLFEKDTSSEFVSQVARIGGHLELLQGASVIVSGSFYLDRTTFTGDVESSIAFLASTWPNSTVDSIFVSGDVSFSLQSSHRDSSVLLSGHSTFSSNTTLGLREVRLLSLNPAFLSAQGKLICHSSSVVIGNHTVLSAGFEAVFFGDSVTHVEALNLPSQHGEFRLPRNATLLLLDVGESRSGTEPQVCLQHLVIPVRVVLQGTVKMWGCVVLPFGGSQSGLVSEASRDVVTATMHFATCSKAFQLPGTALPTCVPLFSPPSRRSGVVIGMGSSQSVYSIEHPGGDKPSFDIDHLSVTPGNRIEAENYAHLVLRESLTISRDASLALLHGGMIRAPLTTVVGVVEVDSTSPVTVKGDVRVQGTLVLGKPANKQCAYPFLVAGELQFVERSALECATLFDGRWGEVLPVAQATRFDGEPFFVRNCAVLTDSQPRESKVEVGRHQVVIRSTGQQPRKPAAAFGVFCCLALGMLAVHVLRIGPSSFIFELQRTIDVPFALSWPEFSPFTPNYVAVMSFAFDCGLLSLVRFHPVFDLPPPFDALRRLAAFFFAVLPEQRDHGFSTFPLVASLFFIGLWLIAWIPLFGGRLSQSLDDVLHRGHNVQGMYFVQMLFQFHTVASWLGVALYIPIASILLEAPICATVLADVPECADVQAFLWPACLALGAFTFVVPLSVSFSHAPFGHPPFIRECDIRWKRSFQYVRYSLLLATVAGWKIFGRMPATAAAVSLLSVGAVMTLHAVSSPCAYGNVNRGALIGLGFPLTASFSAAVELFFSTGTCQTTPILPLGLTAGCWVLLSGTLWFSLHRSGQLSGEYLELNDPEAAAALQSLREQWDLLEQHRLAMYNTADRRLRDTFAVTLSQLRIEYLTRLHAYRHHKEPRLLHFYLGVDARRLFAHDPDTDDEELPLRAPTTDVGKESVLPEDVERLTPDQMSSFTEGPVLGRGTFGTVYMGMLAAGKLVAVKVIPVSRKHKAETLASVKKEVDVLRTLSHPHVIKYFGCQANRKEIFLFMELATSGSLTQLVRKFGALTEPVMRLYSRQLLSGLQYLHDKGIIHRDVKGENVLIDGTGVAKLGDFGCSKAVVEGSHRSQQGCGSLVGSPYWMAPEVIRNESYGMKADVWSLGCTVVEMLNGGHPPWTEKFDNVYSAMFYIGNTTGLPSNIPEDISASCRDFLTRCFEREVNARASVDDLLQHPWVQEGPGSATSSSGLERKWSEMFESESDLSGSHRTSLSRGVATMDAQTPWSQTAKTEE